MAWTPDDVQRILANPTYAGIGPFLQVVERHQWIEGAEKLIKDIGARRFLELMLDELDAALKAAETTAAGLPSE